MRIASLPRGWLFLGLLLRSVLGAEEAIDDLVKRNSSLLSTSHTHIVDNMRNIHTSICMLSCMPLWVVALVWCEILLRGVGIICATRKPHSGNCIFQFVLESSRMFSGQPSVPQTNAVGKKALAGGGAAGADPRSISCCKYAIEIDVTLKTHIAKSINEKQLLRSAREGNRFL